MSMQIPLYRAKKLGSDEYVEGNLVTTSCGLAIQLSHNEIFGFEADLYKHPFVKLYSGETIIIDPSTLAIHFPDMIDSDGKKIFASLSADGKGGDAVVDKHKNKFVCLFHNNSLCFKDTEDNYLIDDEHTTDWIEKITGIQQ